MRRARGARLTWIALAACAWGGAASPAAAAGAVALAIYEPETGPPTAPSPPLEALIHWDSARSAFALSNRGDSSYFWKRSPSGRHVLLGLTYGAETTHGQPIRRLRRDIAWLNYERRTGPPVGSALLILDPASGAARALKLPFTLEHAPQDVGWWDEDHLLLVGSPRDGVLLSGLDAPSGPSHIARLSLADGTFDEIEIPSGSHRLPVEGVADSSSTVVASQGRIAVSVWLPQVVGGGGGALIFDVKPGVLRFTRELDGVNLRGARIATKSLRGPDWLYSIARDRRVVLPLAEQRPSLGRMTGSCTHGSGRGEPIDCTGPEALFFPGAPTAPAVAASPSLLSPADGLMHRVTVTWSAVDSFDPQRTCQVTGVDRSDPPAEGGSDNFWESIDAHDLNLRAASGGVTYWVYLLCSDRAGSSVGKARVEVPPARGARALESEQRE